MAQAIYDLQTEFPILVVWPAFTCNIFSISDWKVEEVEQMTGRPFTDLDVILTSFFKPELIIRM